MKQNIFKSFTFSTFFLLLLASSCSSDNEPDFLAARELQNESYGNDPKQKMDVYLPAGRSPSETPLLIYIHGGAWIDGDKSEFLQVKPLLEKEFPGYAFISLNYRLYDFATGRNGILDQEQDIILAFNSIENQLADWNISDNIVLAGASAGGHLALLHALKNNNSDLKGVIAFFPPTDLTELYKFNNLTALGLGAVLGGTPSTAALNYQITSPVNFVDPMDVPTIFFHGDVDTVVPISQSELLKAAFQNKGVRHQFTKVPGQGHGFTMTTNEELIRQAKEFIGEF
ncbi:alpha/beta hydrolase [Algoriphagus lacus]|uniref:Alpha/beta hydrolase n=1 Tax=Algoriphagus lacus TaxID=2056311 RepID=A0A418PVK4_9BACT|nr:alpha/beta hydrolase [Algoriphagus lacus]RIW18123.1 alpha/beta hydrolase [Algoriphagus lacus]